MLRLRLLISLLSLLLLDSTRGLAQIDSPTPTPTIEILSPIPGDALQGNVLISGRMPPEGFLKAVLAFAYAKDTTNTWFLIGVIETFPENGVLAQWDTTTITDGDYILRLEVITNDDAHDNYLVPALRVRNYTPIETFTPSPSPSPEPGAIATPTARSTTTITPIAPTPTPLPTNPVSVSSQTLADSVLNSSGAVLVLFLLLGIYLAVQKVRRR